MRRSLSITVILALFSSMLSPIMAAACTGTGKAVSCHAVAVDHCDRPVHHHHHQAATPESASAPESKTAFSAAPDDAKCPMDCCTPGHLRSGATVSTHPTLAPPAVSDLKIQIASIVFTVAGFSSHTDRGPPLV
ncbi:MAG TPA: hypothetical protein VE054_14160 [Blattabacteriaceae bacterium]|nr:hypothetical protein [Blattabacteriaceae bacterium]